MTAIFVLLYVLGNVSDMGSNFWLSDWSNDASSADKTGQKSKYFRLGIYALLGFSKCKFFRLFVVVVVVRFASLCSFISTDRVYNYFSFHFVFGKRMLRGHVHKGHQDNAQ